MHATVKGGWGRGQYNAFATPEPDQRVKSGQIPKQLGLPVDIGLQKQVLSTIPINYANKIDT